MSNVIKSIKDQFIDVLLNQNALKFGNYTLKSGRQSPYFFNLGAFNSGDALAKLGFFYATMITHYQLECDVLFGPAYKGIPLVSATAIALATQFKKDIPYCFNRKLKKNYADSGELVGAELEGEVLMVDDVISAGNTVRETLNLIKNYNAKLSAIVIAFDRQEKGLTDTSAVQEVIDTYQVPIYSIVKLEDLIDYLERHKEYSNVLGEILNYRQQYGIFN